MEALASQATSSSCQLQLLVERLTQELAQSASADGAGSQQQPAAMLMGLGGAGSSQLPHRQEGSSSMPSSQPYEQRSPSGPANQGFAQAANGSGKSSGGFFGGKLGWHQGPPEGRQQQAEPQLPPAVPAGGPSRRQQQLAALNAMRLQAGRGYALQSKGLAAARSDSTARPNEVAAASAAAGASNGSGISADETIAAGYHSSSRGSSIVHATSELEGQQQLREATERKLRRGSQVPWAEHQDMVAAALPSLQLSGQAAVGTSGRGATVATRAPAAPRGTAASLNQRLQPLLPRSGKLYSASHVHHPLQHVAARTAAAAAAAVEGRAEAAEATAAAAAEVPATTPKQRQAAVARINRLPALGGYILMGQQHGHTEASAGGTAAPACSIGGASAAADPGPVRAEHGQPDGPVARRINGLGTVEAPDRLKPSARVGATARGAFGDAVVDPHTLLRKKGEWACWAPAYSLSVRWLAGLLHTAHSEFHSTGRVND